MRGPIRAISAVRRDLIWLPEPRPISAPVRVRRAIRIRERRAPLRCLVHSPAGVMHTFGDEGADVAQGCCEWRDNWLVERSKTGLKGSLASSNVCGRRSHCR